MKWYTIYYTDTSGVNHKEDYKTWSEAYAIDCLKHPVKVINHIEEQGHIINLGNINLNTLIQKQ